MKNVIYFSDFFIKLKKSKLKSFSLSLLSKLTCVLICLFFSPYISNAALVEGDNSNYVGLLNGGATSTTVTHTQDAGSNRFMIVYVYIAGSRTTTSVTFNGVALTQLGAKTSVAGNTGQWTVWYKAGLTASTGGNLVANFDACPYDMISVSAYSFTNCNGIGVDNYNGATALNNTTSLTISSNSMIVAGCIAGGNTSAYVEIPDGTTRTLDWNGGSGTYSWGGISPALSSGAKTIQGGSTSNAGIWGVEIKEYTAVPIELLSFNAEVKDKNVNVNWKTASETNNDYFIIEKSYDGTNWTKATESKAIGNSNLQSNYSWIDVSNDVGLCYYKLTQVDKDGTKKSFDIISIDKNKSNILEDIKLYPNPTSDHFSLEYISESDDEFNVIIESDNGKEVYNKRHQILKGENFLNISSDEFASGLYIVVIENNNGLKVTKKVVKE